MKGDEKQKAEVGEGAKPCRFDRLPRPSVFLTKERRGEIKKALAAQNWKKEIYDGIVKANADLWVEREIITPERTGHIHRFFCSDGNRLEIPDEKTQKFTSNEYKCPACGKVYSGEPYDGGRRWQENRWRYFACRDLALTYAVSGDKRYAKKAADILVKYADAYPGRHTTHVEGGIAYQSLCEGVMMIPLAQAYDMIYDAGVLSDEEKNHIEYDFFWESAQGLVKMGIGGNWGSWHLCAVGTIGMATRHQRFIDHGINGFKSQIEKQLGSDGLWPESVHTYHFYPLSAFIHFAEACANMGEDLYNWKAENGNSLKSMFTAPISYMYPDARLPAINDGWYDTWLPSGQYEAAYFRYKEPELASALVKSYRGKDRGADITHKQFQDEPWALILGAEIPDDAPPLSLKSANFDNLGICVLRAGNPSIEKEIVLTFDYGRFLGHGQLDKMGVTLFAEGRVMAADYGTPGYGSEILPYYKGSLSHNVVIVDGKNQVKTKKGELSIFQDAPLLKAARSVTEEAYPGVKWTRTVMLTDSYAAVIDDLESEEERQYDWFFHNEGDELSLEGCHTSPTLAQTFKYPYITEAKGFLPERELGKASWKFEDGTSLVAWFEQTPGLQLFSARTPAETGARSVPLLVLRQKGKTARFLSVLFPRGKDYGSELEILGTQSDEMTIRYQNKKDNIFFGAPLSIRRTMELEEKYKPPPLTLRLDKKGPLCKRAEELLLKQAKYLISTLETWERKPGALALTKMQSGEHSIRPNAHTAFGLAVMYRSIPEKYPPGLSREICKNKAIGILRCLLSCHGAGDKVCGDEKKWRNQWQSALWAASSGLAAWLLWEDLDPELQWLAAKMICDEADRFVDKIPPTQIENDTKAEENAWNSKILALAYNMFPRHPKHEAYGEAALRWAISSYARESDVKSPEILDGKPLSEWLTAGNAHEDYTVENHGIVHPDYMNACDQCIYLILMYDWTKNPAPKGILFNTDKVYANLKIFSFPDAGYIYPNGQDWRIHRNPDWIRIHAAQSVLFQDSQAATLLRLALDTTERMAARNPEGGIYFPGEWFFPSAHHMYFECLAKAYLLMASRGEGVAPLTEEQLWKELSGRYMFNAGKFGILRTPRSIATFSWGRRVMGMALPLQKDMMLTPYELGMAGSVNVDGVKKEYPSVKKIETQEISDHLGFCGILDRAGGALTQRFGFLALSDGRTVYIDHLSVNGDAKTLSLELGSLGILNEPGWVYHTGKRTLYHKNGEIVFDSSGEEEPPVLLNSPWYNIDDELGIVSLTATAKSRYVPNKKSVRGRVEQLFHLNYVEKPDSFPVETVLIFYPGWKKEETRAAAEKCSLEKHSPGIFKLKLDDGKRIEFDLTNLTIKEER